MDNINHTLNQATVYRRVALFLSMLISGGWLLFPREPILLIIIVLCVAATGARLPMGRHMGLVVIWLSAVLIVTLIRPGEFSFASIVSRNANFAAALLLLNAYLHAPGDAFVRDLQLILRPMAYQAIATVLLAYSLGSLFVTISTVDWDTATVLYIFNYHTTYEDAGRFVRPDGFFFEPGVFQIYLNLYLYLALFLFRNPRQVGVATLAVISTQSTTGIVICVILLTAALGKYLMSGDGRYKFTLLLIAIAAAPPIVYLAYDNISEKVSGRFEGSTLAREYDFYTGLNIIANNPLLGIGFEVKRYFEESDKLGYDYSGLARVDLDERPTSNSLIHLFYCLGIPLAIPFLLGFFRQTVFPHRMLIGIWLVLSLYGEGVLFTPFFMTIVFSGFIRKPTDAPAESQLPHGSVA